MQSLTVGIATWNRAHLLRGTLDQLLASSVPAGVSREIVVVDNNSNDETPLILESYREKYGIVPLHESRQGKSHALNRIIKVASGDYMLWIDDDIRVEKDWMVHYYDAFVRWPDAAVFGGTITPSFLETPPNWILEGMDEIGGVFGLCQPSPGPFVFGDSPLPFGGNMAVRMDVQRKFAFDERMGRKGGQLLTGEEADLVSRILQHNHKGSWVPEARVRHVIPPRMQTLSYVRRYFHDFGASLALMRLQEMPKSRKVPPPLWVWRDALQQEVLYRFGRMLGRPVQSWIRNLRLAAFAQGSLIRRPMRVDL